MGNSVDAAALKLGFFQVNQTASKDGGFKRASVARECVGVTVPAMRLFPVDANLQAYACLVLGWALFGHPGVAMEMRKEGDILECVQAAKENFPFDVGIAGNAQWAIAMLN